MLLCVVRFVGVGADEGEQAAFAGGGDEMDGGHHEEDDACGEDDAETEGDGHGYEVACLW